MKKTLSMLLAVLLLCTMLPLTVSASQRPANVILMIGDGMGWNHLQLAKQERGISLFMENECDVRGWSMTRSQNREVTDSAAGGTALSSGVRTNNRYVATYHYDPLGWFIAPRTLCEAAKASGRRSGVVTTDKTYGATPASFTAHSKDRDNSRDITRQQLKSDFDLIWGGRVGTFSEPLAEKNGFTVITTAQEMQALQPGSKSFAQFEPDQMWQTKPPEGCDAPTLSQMTEKAISLLDNENGFFLMVEAAHIDKMSHGDNEPEESFIGKTAGAAEAVEEFDNAIRVAVDYARKDGNTLIVITADHETGCITKQEDGRYAFTTSSHTGVDVPLIVFGSKDFIEPDEHIENRQVAQRIGEYMQLGTLFPATIPGKLVSPFVELYQKLIALLPNASKAA